MNEQRDMWYRFYSDVKEEEKLIGTLEVFHIIVNLLGNLFPLPLEGQTDVSLSPPSTQVQQEDNSL